MEQVKRFSSLRQESKNSKETSLMAERASAGISKGDFTNASNNHSIYFRSQMCEGSRRKWNSNLNFYQERSGGTEKRRVRDRERERETADSYQSVGIIETLTVGL
jgi:hypothetical protein